MLNIVMLLRGAAPGLAHNLIRRDLPAEQITLNNVVTDMPGLELPHPELPPASLPLDHIIELRPAPGIDPAALWDAARAAMEDAGAKLIGGFIADEVVQVDYNRYWRDGEPTPGPKVIWFARKRDDVDHDHFVARWRQHALLVWRIHTGIWRYSQNVVARAFPGAPDGVTGIAVTQYRSVDDFLTRQYPREGDRQEIIDDVSAFTAGAEAYVTRERILRSATPEPQPRF